MLSGEIDGTDTTGDEEEGETTEEVGFQGVDLKDGVRRSFFWWD